MTSTVIIENVSFPLVSTADEFMMVIKQGNRAAWRLRSTDYASVLQSVTPRINSAYGGSSPQYKELTGALLYCAGCMWEFPGSYLLSLQSPDAFGGWTLTTGMTPGAGGFGQQGKCPKCGDTESLWVYDCVVQSDITESDVQAIRRYWHTLARRWWEGVGRRDAICDRCDTPVAFGEGYLRGSDLNCDSCVSRTLSDDVVENLRRNPHYYGVGLLRKARALTHG